MVDIVSMHRKSVVQEEFFLAVIIEVAEDHFCGVRIDKGWGDCVRFLNVVCHVTDWVCLKIAIVPITSSWSVLRLRLLTSFSTGQGQIERGVNCLVSCPFWRRWREMFVFFGDVSFQGFAGCGHKIALITLGAGLQCKQLTLKWLDCLIQFLNFLQEDWELSCILKCRSVVLVATVFPKLANYKNSVDVDMSSSLFLSIW